MNLNISPTELRSGAQTREQVLARAEALVPVLASRSEACEKLRRAPAFGRMVSCAGRVRGCSSGGINAIQLSRLILAPLCAGLLHASSAPPRPLANARHATPLCAADPLRRPQVLSAVFFMDLKGKILISRNYRGDVSRAQADK